MYYYKKKEINKDKELKTSNYKWKLFWCFITVSYMNKKFVINNNN